ncbi:MAG: molybdenum cofactor guanylyltransferase [Alphaproteobacteria bacterium]|nr:molybdenum cofactor guanylyltransferase [Alphaproteobacteria bacterium]
MGGVALKRGAILGVVLAGGQSRRFGQDKAVARIGADRLIERVVARATPQVAAMAVSGRDYGLCLPVIVDSGTSEGPLTGVLSSLRWAGRKGFSAVATFSCDAPFFPEDLVARLASELRGDAACIYARSCGGRHPIFACWRVRALPDLERCYDDGVRALKTVQDRLEAVAIDFPEGPAPDGDMFFNINHPLDGIRAGRWLEDHRNSPCLAGRHAAPPGTVTVQ